MKHLKEGAVIINTASVTAYLACADSPYRTGQVLHPNGGEIVNG